MSKNISIVHPKPFSIVDEERGILKADCRG